MKVISNGVALNVTDTGVGETTLVFLHHFGGSTRTWADVIGRLESRFRCVAIEARGTGDSEAPASGYSTHDHTKDAQGVIDALALERFIIIGHSMGGKAAQLLASKQPKGLIGLVLTASAPPSPAKIDEQQREQMRGAYGNRESIEFVLDNVLLGSPISTEARKLLIAEALRVTPQAKSGWIDIGTSDDIRTEAKSIDVPMVIVAGDSDRVDPLDVVKTEIVPVYPRAELHLLPGKGHILPLEAPLELATIIGDFVGVLQR